MSYIHYPWGAIFVGTQHPESGSCSLGKSHDSKKSVVLPFPFSEMYTGWGTGIQPVAMWNSQRQATDSIISPNKRAEYKPNKSLQKGQYRFRDMPLKEDLLLTTRGSLGLQ